MSDIHFFPLTIIVEIAFVLEQVIFLLEMMSLQNIVMLSARVYRILVTTRNIIFARS